MDQDRHRFSEENLLLQLKTAPYALGYYTLRFYTENGRPVNKVTDSISEFFLYPSGGTLRDDKSNIVFYNSRFDTYRGFKPPHLQKETQAGASQTLETDPPNGGVWMNPVEQDPSLRVRGVLETSLYVDDLERSAQFYQRLFGFERLVTDERLYALSVSGKQVLLLFRKGGSTQPSETPGGRIPRHDGSGEIHVAFAIAPEDLPRWEQRLADNAIIVESKVVWSRGGSSLYFRDPDNHSIELAATGTWPIY